jgi:hypothetical protein
VLASELRAAAVVDAKRALRNGAPGTALALLILCEREIIRAGVER